MRSRPVPSRVSGDTCLLRPSYEKPAGTLTSYQWHTIYYTKTNTEWQYTKQITGSRQTYYICNTSQYILYWSFGHRTKGASDDLTKTQAKHIDHIQWCRNIDEPSIFHGQESISILTRDSASPTCKHYCVWQFTTNCKSPVCGSSQTYNDKWDTRPLSSTVSLQSWLCSQIYRARVLLMVAGYYTRI